MSDGSVKPPKAASLVKLEVFPDGTMNLQSPLPPKELLKIFHSITTEILFNAMPQKEESNIVVPRMVQ